MPVIGVLIFDPSMTKYYFKLGADANVDIALQRCITEVFQGLSFDLNFRLRMNECYVSDTAVKGFWFSDDRAYDHIRAEIDGTGRLPRGFFRSIANTTDIISGFCDSVITNDEAVKFMLERCKTIADTVGLINYTKYGVPCIRIVMPDVCASLYYPTDKEIGLYNTLKSIRKFRTTVEAGKYLTKDTLNCILNILQYPAYTYAFSMTKLLGVITTHISDAPYIYSPYLFAAYLALYLKEYDIAEKYIDIYNVDARVNEVIRQVDKVIIKAFKEEVRDEQIMEYFCGFGSNEKIIEEVNNLIRIHKNGFKIPSCPNCETCNLRGKCCYDTWEKLQTSMIQSDHNYMNEDFRKFIALCREAVM